MGLICRPFSFHGGVETATAGLLGALRHAGHDVELISTRRQASVPGLVVRRVPTLRHPSVLRLISFALAARAAAARHGYDLVQSHERALGQDLYRAGEGCHAAYLEAMGRRVTGLNPYHRLVLALERRIFQLRTARHVVAISRQGKEEIERRFGTDPARVTLIYNGVDLERFHPDNRGRHRRPTREALRIPEEAWTVLFVGSGFERKGLGPLLEAFARVRGRGKPAGRDREGGRGALPEPGRAASASPTARSGPGRRRRWSGSTPPPTSVALPARYEPFGNVHLEALASGVPVLSSARAGGSEIVCRGENGWVAAEPSRRADRRGARRAPRRAGGRLGGARARLRRALHLRRAGPGVHRSLRPPPPLIARRPPGRTLQTLDFH